MTKPRQSLKLHEKQMEVYRSTKRFRVVVAGRRWGKALALDTPIPTPSGWTTMGELKDGDQVFDESGAVCNVVHAHPVMNDRPCYEVEFSDGTTIVADEEHLWSTWTHSARKNSRRNPKGKYGPEVRTTKQILETLNFGKRGDTNHSIPCARPVKCDRKELPVDPYMFGAWLGDGDSMRPILTAGVEDFEHFFGCAYVYLGKRPITNRDALSGAWRIKLYSGRDCERGVGKKLRAMNVIGNKHIPEAYLRGSVDQRLALLQGLMDTDGYCDLDAGNCEFTSTVEKLASGAFELVLSLGIKATMIEGRATLNGKDCGPKWRIKFSTDLPVFRLERKLARMPKERRFRVDHRFIKAVRPVPSVPVRCITVDSPNSLYLCSRAFVPTHNTALSRVLIILAAKKPRQKIWYVAPTYRMAKQIMWTDMLDAIPKKWIEKINETTLMIRLINGTRIELKGADKPDTLRGVGIHFLVLDEFQDMSPDTWTKVLRPTLADTGGKAVFIATPKSYNYLYELYKLGQRGEEYIDPHGRERTNHWQSWQFPTITSPFIPESEIESARQDMDDKSFNQEFLASFESMSGRVYYPFDRKVHVGKFAFNPSLQTWIGMDFNIDPMSAVVMQKQTNGDVWIVDEVVLKSSNTEETCEALERKYWRWQDKCVVYPDPAGGQRQHARGETDIDILREKGFRKVKYRKKHPAVADRVNAVNKLLRAANGTIRLFVDEKCKHVINALEQTIYKKGSRDVDKDASVEHAADALGYCLELEFPVRRFKPIGFSK